MVGGGIKKTEGWNKNKAQSSIHDRHRGIKWFPSAIFDRIFPFPRILTSFITSRGQFHQHFTSSFYASRSQKLKKRSQIKQLFVLLGPAWVKGTRKHVDEIDPSSHRRRRHPSFNLDLNPHPSFNFRHCETQSQATFWHYPLHMGDGRLNLLCDGGTICSTLLLMHLDVPIAQVGCDFERP